MNALTFALLHFHAHPPAPIIVVTEPPTPAPIDFAEYAQEFMARQEAQRLELMKDYRPFAGRKSKRGQRRAGAFR